MTKIQRLTPTFLPVLTNVEAMGVLASFSTAHWQLPHKRCVRFITMTYYYISDALHNHDWFVLGFVVSVHLAQHFKMYELGMSASQPAKTIGVRQVDLD